MPKKQKSGLYRSKVKIGVDPDGKDILKYISGKTKRELEQARQDVIARYITGTALQPDQLFGSYAVNWFKTVKQSELEPSTISTYRSMLNKHILPTFGDRKLQAISASDLQIWLNGFAGKSSSAIQQAHTTITGIFAAAFADRILPNNPAAALKTPKAAKAAERRSLTPEETEKILYLIDHHPRGAYLACMYYLGVRPGEARGLQWGDFDFKKNIVHIRRDIDFKASGNAGALKTDFAYRDIPLPQPLIDLLQPLAGNPDAFLFTGSRSGSPLSKATSERIWLDMMQSVGMVQQRDQKKQWKNPDIRSQFKPTITPHFLRHNFITKCWESGLDPFVTMRIVGHADYRTTMNIYTHLNDEKLLQARQKLGGAFEIKKVAQKLHNSDSTNSEK